MTARTRTAAILAALALTLTGCTAPPTGDCGPGRQRGPDGISCDTIPVTPDNNNPATDRAEQAREDDFDDCRTDGYSEQECLDQGHRP